VVGGDTGTVVGAGACRVCPAGALGWVLVLLPHAATPTAAAAARATPTTIFRAVRPLSVIRFPLYVTREARVTRIYGRNRRTDCAEKPKGVATADKRKVDNDFGRVVVPATRDPSVDRRRPVGSALAHRRRLKSYRVHP
jgi:hypothetical protein